MIPTKEQEKEFWEWCGWDLTYHQPSSSLSVCEGYIHKDSNGHTNWYDKPPKLDLNSLFKWAVSVIPSESDISILFREIHWTDGKIFTECVIRGIGHEIGRATEEGELKDMVALTLFWAIYGIIK